MPFRTKIFVPDVAESTVTENFLLINKYLSREVNNFSIINHNEKKSKSYLHQLLEYTRIPSLAKQPALKPTAAANGLTETHRCKQMSAMSREKP